MYRGFPRTLIETLRCPHDDGVLVTGDTGAGSSTFVQRAVLHCRNCDREYPIQDGIVRFLEPRSLDPVSSGERNCRDQEAESLDPALETTPWNQMEILPTMEASEPLKGARVLELGAGTGRHTAPMANRGASILAVDFSENSLTRLAARVEPDWTIGLALADCTHFHVEPNAFDVVASTLVSNLPTGRHRSAMMRVAATACRRSGRFVFGTHHFGIRSRISGEARSGYYRDAPIYRYMFRRSEIVTETQRYFRDVDCHPIQIRIPLAARMGLPVLKLSRIAERIPLINELGTLLLVVGRRPKLTPREPRPGGLERDAKPVVTRNSTRDGVLH